MIDTVPLMTQVNRKYTNETLRRGTSCSFTLTRSHEWRAVGRETGLWEWSGGNSERLKTVRTRVKSPLPTPPVTLLSLSYSRPSCLKVLNLSSLQIKNTHVHTKHGFPRSYTNTCSIPKKQRSCHSIITSPGGS